MAKYLIRASYTAEGLRGVLKEGGSARRSAAQKAIEAAGGKLESFYYAFGEDDAYVVADMPDHAAAAAVSMVVGASGAVRARTVVLLTPEEIDRAAKVTVPYRAPGA